MILRRLLCAGALVLAVANVGACDSSMCSDATCGASSSDGGAADAGVDVTPDAPSQCLDGSDPKDNAACVVDALGVFVSAQGDDANAGTKAKPVKTIGAGIAKAAAGKSRVFVCEGNYDELVKIDATADGVSLYGGWSCATWAYSGNKAKVAPSKTGIVLTVSATTKAIVVEDIELDAKDGAAAGESSIAAFANGAANLVLRRLSINAGNGSAGTAGALGTSNYDVSLTNDNALIAGHDALTATGGLQQDCAGLCANAIHSTGGRGGNGDPAQPQGGAKGLPDLGAGTGGNGGAVCSNGIAGASAPAAPGGTASTSSGALTATGWNNSGSSGGNGTPGNPGQGGGGGGGGISTTRGGGAGGGCGGCGGAGATGGQAGGSSFALASVASTIVLDACNVHASDAKIGGKGGDGQTGQSGGITGATAVSGCPAGSGGQGGQGGGGAGGAGGHSVAIAYTGTAPTQKGGTTTFGTLGAGGAAGAGGSPAAQKGKDGVAAATMSF